MSGNPFEILRKEHETVLEILDGLEGAIEGEDLKAVEKKIDTLEKEFDKHSIKKEEKVLFPEIEKFVPRDGGPTGVMFSEHKDLVGSIKKFKIAMKAKDLDELKDVGKYIVNVLRQHIDKENNILFIMADMHLDEKQKANILKRFNEIDAKLGVH